ncbi:interphotoreceptor retinoid-binding protein [Pseudoalteromonas sp. A25]|uniref:S41 family peptidase n=1 Tax=Pseudoalteromonas sp. A25 TaxID=116092 RepID=UPI00126078D6|nr:S41 family peptidase [Pseudoalteromonas sp. A25]BBN82510.1 interphotoreceptor retinoid-binding protein [Pseudoalteromonas sp. A25]
MKRHLSLILVGLGMVVSSVSSAQERVKTSIVQELTRSIEQNYVQEQKIPQIVSALKALSNTDAFKTAADDQALLLLLNQELKKFDQHLSLSIVPKKDTTEKGSKQRYESWFDKLERKNFGFEKVEILPANVGLLSFWGFANVTPRSKQKVHSAMTLLEDADSIIIDLRNNGGGDATMVQLISSYFLDKPTHLNSFYSRDTGLTSEFWTVPVAGKQRPNVPIYILTSNKTFSAAEEFAYNFKHLGRATIIGEPTKGGANPWRFINLTSDMRVAMPTSMAVNPVTKSNWEGVGVIPHVKVESDLALDVAYSKALQHLRGISKDTRHLNDIELALKTLKQHH